MPLYLYECPNCTRLFEVIKPSRDRAQQRCPDCEKEAKLKMSTCNWSCGWKFTDRCNEVGGPKDEIERDI